MFSRIYIYVLVTTVGISISDACFPGNTWINCLLNTCTIYKTCPGDPTAKCTIKRTECGCEAKFYKPSGELAECNVRKNHKLCPGGETIVQCEVDVCNLQCGHPDFLNAPCRQNNCGQCTSEFFVHEKWVPCPSENQPSKPLEPTGQMVVTVGNPASCVNFVPCNIKICIDEKCPLEPRAVCRPDGCNECKPAWYLNNVRVNCYPPGAQPVISNEVVLATGPDVCPAGQSQVPCDMSICDQQICRNYPDAVCSPNGCGKCAPVWSVGGTQVDCLSDACPANVPFVKCVADPCEVFGHYCPHAQCRATQCGKCDAKFFVNGEEIDCVMPPKTCATGVTPLNCKWFTCPSNVCPSNKRLMCRIDPCGPSCKHDWVDIYNGEIMTCRVFDGDGRTIKQQSEKIYMKDPLTPFFPKESAGSVKGSKFPNTMTSFDNNQLLGQDQLMTQSDVTVSTGPGKFKVEPLFMKPRHIQSGNDLYAMLNAFEHELMGISSLSIQNVLRKGKFREVPLPLPTVPLEPSVDINTPLESGPIEIPAMVKRKEPAKSSVIEKMERLRQPIVPAKEQNIASPNINDVNVVQPSQNLNQMASKTPIQFSPKKKVLGNNDPTSFLDPTQGFDNSVVQQQAQGFDNVGNFHSSDPIISPPSELVQVSEMITGVNLPSPFSLMVSEQSLRSPDTPMTESALQPADASLTQQNIPTFKTTHSDGNLPFELSSFTDAQSNIQKASLPMDTMFSNLGPNSNIQEAPLPMDLSIGNDASGMLPSTLPGDSTNSIGLNLPSDIPIGIDRSAVMAVINNIRSGIQPTPQEIAAALGKQSNAGVNFDGQLLKETGSNLPQENEMSHTLLKAKDRVTEKQDQINTALQSSNRAPINLHQELPRSNIDMAVSVTAMPKLSDVSITHSVGMSKLPSQTDVFNDVMPTVDLQTQTIPNDAILSGNIPIQNELLQPLQPPSNSFGVPLNVPFTIGAGMTPPKDFSFWQPDNTASGSTQNQEFNNNVFQSNTAPASNEIPKQMTIAVNESPSSLQTSGQKPSSPTGVEKSGVPINMDMLQQWATQ